VKTDRMLMAFGVEGRVPFLDHRLVELGLTLPDDLKIRGHQGKWLLKEWARPYLPPGHLDRPKRGFHVPVGDWLRGERVTQIGRRLAANRGIERWFELGAVADLIAASRAGRGTGRELWGLMQFAIWHRIFIEQPGLRPTPDEDPLDWIASEA
jgi:asparagine synthase (glutamine-hydrolysing)